ncbi:Transposable element Tcb2 transposase [Oopsacas minuta]|uniref:Transposable element Tcb2 transposase n=1 Tax=Oopsacas minuta TaxID=111878 RepID=A0AAV7KDU4_9METZ|nr:Transposable element Tcb2 transposase [Oopsacas minuta]
MTKTSEVPIDIRNQIIGLLNGNKHGVREIARMYSLSHSTIISLRNKWECKRDIQNVPRTGRPKKITAHGTRQLKNIVKSNRTKTLESLTNLFNSGKDDEVSSKTVARTLHSLGFHARKACRKPMISKKNQKKAPFLQTFWRNFRRRKPQAKFMQDNAPCHKSKKVLSWFGSKKVSILDWPPQSPDLNPIENLWALLFTAVREKHEQKINTLQELRVAIREEWGKIPIDILQRLYASIPVRLKEVKKAKGNATKY